MGEQKIDLQKSGVTTHMAARGPEFASDTNMIDSSVISVTDIAAPASDAVRIKSASKELKLHQTQKGFIPEDEHTPKKRGCQQRSIVLSLIDAIFIIIPVGLAVYLSILVDESPVEGADDADWYLLQYGYGYYTENLSTLRIIYGVMFGWNVLVILAILLLSAREFRMQETPPYRKAFLGGYAFMATVSCGFWIANLSLYLFPMDPPADNLILFMVELVLFISVALFSSVVLIRLRALYRIYRRCDYNPRYKTFMIAIFIFMLVVNIPEIVTFVLCGHNASLDSPNPSCPEWLSNVPLSYFYYVAYTAFYSYYTYHLWTYPDRHVYLSNVRLAVISTLWWVGTVATFYGTNSAQMDGRAFCGYTSLLSVFTIEMFGNAIYDERECEYRDHNSLSDEDEKNVVVQRNKKLAGVGYYFNSKELCDVLHEIAKARYCDEIVLFLEGLFKAHRATQSSLEVRRSRNNTSSSMMKRSRRSEDDLGSSAGRLDEECVLETCGKKYYLTDMQALYEQFVSVEGTHCVNVTHVLRVQVEQALRDCLMDATNSDANNAKRVYASRELAIKMDQLALHTIRLLSQSGVWENFKADERVEVIENRKEAMQKYGLGAKSTGNALSTPSRQQTSATAIV